MGGPVWAGRWVGLRIRREAGGGLGGAFASLPWGLRL